MRQPRLAWWKAVELCAASGVFAGALIAGRLRSPPQPRAARPESAPAVAAGFVGQAVCASCHPREAAAWAGSHHQRATQPASEATVLGDFAGASFAHAGVSSTLFRRAGAYVVRTDGPDGALHDYEVKYTFGVAPLQQYLVAFPGGRLQSPEIAWDSRPATAGGQRWFHLYPGEHIDPTDPLHWTGATENWNSMCADCHSTNVRKSWSAQTGVYATQFAELSVSCEACHGPGAQHVAWASDPPDRRRASADKGLSIALDERAGVLWPRDPSTHRPARSRPRDSAREIEMCARCHARRGLLHEDVVHGQPAGDDYRIALLDDDLYYPDGQIKGEVYEYGSFVQSRMFAEGVTCSDCHDPHGGGLRAPGNGLCLSCHEPAYATAKHHFHGEGSQGAQCVGCHMPATTYMVVDPRRDHSLRVPRPDLSVTLGVPNPCTGCHTDRPPVWAARTVEAWYGHAPSGLQQFAGALAAGTQGAPGAQRLLAALIADRSQPAIARASAIARLERWATPATLATARGALDDPSSLVRRAAVHALADADPRTRAQAAPRLDDAVRAVRLEAAAALAGVPVDALPAASRAALDRATAELVAALELNGDRPDAHLSLAALDAKQGAPERAEAELQRARSLDPAFVPASVNLADLYRLQGRDAAAESVLREALARTPRAPSLWHALGLVLVRERRLGEAIDALGAATRLGPDDPRSGYVYAVALHDAGRRSDALRELARVLAHHPYDRDSLAAGVAFHREAGDLRSALRCAEQLVAIDPQDPAAMAAMNELRDQVTRR
jgi:predicted CXXCH cytochrome family protein